MDEGQFGLIGKLWNCAEAILHLTRQCGKSGGKGPRQDLRRHQASFVGLASSVENLPPAELQHQYFLACRRYISCSREAGGNYPRLVLKVTSDDLPEDLRRFSVDLADKSEADTWRDRYPGFSRAPRLHQIERTFRRPPIVSGPHRQQRPRRRKAAM